MANPFKNISSTLIRGPGLAVMNVNPFRLGAVRARSTQVTARVEPAITFSLVRFFCVQDKRNEQFLDKK
jgi:hypothetical protein